MAGLNVIALVSGGKDSFFSALHCLENGHRLVALANLHPPLPKPPSSSTAGVSDSPDGDQDASVQRLGSRLSGLDLQKANDGDHDADDDGGQQQDETDLNSFMYQTVGHQVIPLYAEATGLPLFRQPILGGAVQSARDYSTAKVAAAAVAAAAAEQGGAQDEDETESLVPLLQAVMAQHPEANALSAGAILSTYQRTRVESVALRLGLTPLAYLWKYPVLPPPLPPASLSMGGAGVREEAQLLFDMAATGLDVRMIKVASGGLDESFLWENVASARGVMRLKKAMAMFGSAGMDTGAVLGEGGEFETLVVDGPTRLFKKRLVVEEQHRDVVREGGGAAWVKVKHAELVDKESADDQGQSDAAVRKPDMFDERFSKIIKTLSSGDGSTNNDNEAALPTARAQESIQLAPTSHIETWTAIHPQTTTTSSLTIQDETTRLVNDIRARLAARNLTPPSILSTIIVLRSMGDFPAVNAIYGSLFADPNPPARVTIACGHLIPQSSANIAIYLTLDTTSSSSNNRQGLHVQSRSYWAPANIGPYSQAITFPTATTTTTTSPCSSSPSDLAAQVIHIAGQIPLIPATMDLPLPSEGLAVQLALSLQHLWRIGAEVRVQWWTSGAVYFPRSTSSSSSSPISPISMREKAHLAYRAWTEAHKFSAPSASSADTDDDNDEDGPDLWDRRFNSAYMSASYYYGGGGDHTDAGNGIPDLPDYSVLAADDDDDGAAAVVPFFFAVEVDALPRGAEAEWHAHAGLGNIASTTANHRNGIQDATVRVFCQRRGKNDSDMSSSDGDDDDDDGREYQVEHCMLTSKKSGGCLHSVIAAMPASASSSHEPASTSHESAAPTTTTTTNTTHPSPSPAPLPDLLHTANRLFARGLATFRVKTDSLTTPTRAAGQNPETEAEPEPEPEPEPYLVYIDAEMLACASSDSSAAATSVGNGSSGEEQIAQALKKGIPVIPCASIWIGGRSGGAGTDTGTSTGPTRAVGVLLYRKFFGGTGHDDDEEEQQEDD